MNQEAMRQHSGYAEVRNRLWPKVTKLRPRAPVLKAIRTTDCDEGHSIPEVVKPIIVVRQPVPRKVKVVPWPRPLWMTAPLHFNQHVVAWLRHKLAIEHDEETPRRTMGEIANEVLEMYPGITLADLRLKSRRQIVVVPRQLAMYRIYRERLDLSLPEIGRFFGGFDHTTVLHAVRKYEPIFGYVQRSQTGSKRSGGR